MLQKQSYGSVEIIALDRAEALEQLTLAAKRLRDARPEVVEVLLFGSIARGDQAGASDADILVLIDQDMEFDPLGRAREYLAFFTLPIGIDLLVVSKADAEHRLLEMDPFLSRIWSEGLPLGQSSARLMPT